MCCSISWRSLKDVMPFVARSTGPHSTTSSWRLPSAVRSDIDLNAFQYLKPCRRLSDALLYDDEFPARLRIHDARRDRVALAMIRIEKLAVRSSPGERLEQPGFADRKIGKRLSRCDRQGRDFLDRSHEFHALPLDPESERTS